MAASITTLTTYLSTIQTVKSQIDGVLSYVTGDRTPFSQYPTYIQTAIEDAGGSTGTLLSEVFGADENDYKVYVEFNETDDSFTYSFDCTWDGSNWTGSLSNAGFALVGKMGNATQYDSESGQMVENPSFMAIQMHVANGALYLGDVFAATGESLNDGSGEYAIAADMWPNTKFLNNGFGAGPENLDMTGWASGTLTFTLTVPKNLPVNYDTGYDYIGDGDSREIEHPCVYLDWMWNGVSEK